MAVPALRRPWRLILEIAIDIVLINASFILAYWIRYQWQWPAPVAAENYRSLGTYLPMSAILTLLLIAAYGLQKVYSQQRGRTWLDEAYALFSGIMTGTLAMIVITYFLPALSYSRTLFPLAAVIIFLALTILAGGMTQGIAPTLPLYFVDGLHLGKAFAASMVSISSVAGLWAAVAGGYLSDRIGRMPVIFITFLLGGVIVFLYGRLPWGIGFGALLFFAGVCSYMRMPVAETFIMSLTTPKNRSTIYGIYFAVSQEASSALSLLVGWLTSTYGYIFTFNLSAAVIVGASLVAGIYLWRKEQVRKASFA